MIVRLWRGLALALALTWPAAVGAQTVVYRDTTGQSPAAPADSVPSATNVAPPSPTVVQFTAPVDTALARACADAPAGSEAPGLLSVVFRAGPSVTDKAAAAKAVGGAMAGETGYGEEYVKLAVGSGPLTVVADRLIRQDPVVRVSPAPCPPPPASLPTAVPGAPADSGGAAAGGASPAPSSP